ncbi:MAG: endonuclease/exonuclease/phosphatase family protein [Gaiellaceae bacterium]
MLIRTWNLFHGNTVPPGRAARLEEAVRLAASGDPAIVCLQEVPAWALELLDDWSGMVAVGDVASRPRAGRELGRRLTALNAGLIRSALAGQANAILVASGLRILERHVIVLRRGSFRLQRRICQVVRLRLPDERMLAVGSLHASNVAHLADSEVLRAAAFLDEIAAPGDIAVLAGDFNVSRSPAVEEVLTWGFSEPGPGIDHVLVRGAESGPEERWPDKRRTVGGALLSDHAPVEVNVR